MAANVPGQIASDAPIENDDHTKATYRLAHPSFDRGRPPDGGLQLPEPAHLPLASAGGEADRGTPLQRLKEMLITVRSFIGPGFMISVAYSVLDVVILLVFLFTSLTYVRPVDYSTGIAAGALYRFRLLFVVLLSDLFSIFLQSLAIKLGTVSGLNLAEAGRAFLPRWLNYILYAFAEVAIIATDIAEVGP